MPKIKNPFAAAAAFAERLSNPDTPLPLPRRSVKGVRADSEPAAEELTTEEEAPSVSEIAEAPAPEAKSALHQPRILKEYVIPMADDTPEAVTFSAFTEEESEESPAEAPAEAVPSEIGQPAPDSALHRAPRPVKAGLTDELASNLWALAILLGVACTVVAFFVGALA